VAARNSKTIDRIRELYTDVQRTPPYVEMLFLVLILLVALVGWWIGQ
jgi:hypothetical protein